MTRKSSLDYPGAIQEIAGRNSELYQNSLSPASSQSQRISECPSIPLEIPDSSESSIIQAFIRMI